MRKIISKEEENKKRKRNQLIIGGVLVLVMVLSVLGYSIGRNDENKEEIVYYKGFKFTKQDGFWGLSLENFQFYFKYNPNEVEELNVSLNQLNSYLAKPLYVYSESPEAAGEIYKNLFYYNNIVERVQDACPVEEECEEDVPTKTCENNFLIFKESNETSVRKEDNCVFIEGKNEDLASLSDSFLFKIIGVQ